MSGNITFKYNRKLLDKRSESMIEIKARGLGFPEGPIALKTGEILICDLYGGTVLKVEGDRSSVFAQLGGSPNGLAMGADNWLYVANNGGAMRWKREGEKLISEGFQETGFDTRIERINLYSGKVERILNQVGGQKLQAIDDLIFDTNNGFWFTDLGRDGKDSRTYGGIYWSSADGSKSTRAAYPIVNGANGIGLSPDGKTLYATEYGAGRLWAWTIGEPGVLCKSGDQKHGGKLIWQSPDATLLDSLAISASGNIIIATQPTGVFSIISPTGELVDTVDMPEDFPTNLCFDQNNPYVAYATLSQTGCLATILWPEPGFNPQIPIDNLI